MKTRAKLVASSLRVANGKKFKLSDHKPTAKVPGFPQKDYKDVVKKCLREIADLQKILYASNTWSLLLVFQGMDTSGKDGTIGHVMHGVNPQGCQVYSFKSPSAEELSHDFLWRCSKRLPRSGQIGIFNRSHYEEVLVVRIHPALLAMQRRPAAGLPGETRLWRERFEDIVCFERHLARNGVKILKFFLNISADEQRRRLLARLDEPDKHWKHEPNDLTEREHWHDYMRVYEDMIRNTSTPEAPWHVIPANDKDHARFAVSAIVLDALRSLDIDYPRLDAGEIKSLKKARRTLERKTK
jgi:PPK2 family polyphosphate:nucleotide phosphotransferase